MNEPVYEFDFDGVAVTGTEIDGERWFQLSEICNAFGLETLDSEFVDELIEREALTMLEITTDGNKTLALFIKDEGVYFGIAYRANTSLARKMRRAASKAIRECRKDLGYDDSQVFEMIEDVTRKED